MAGTAVTQQSPVPLRPENQIQETGDGYAAKEVVPEEAVTKELAEEADASTAQNKHHESESSRDEWRILARF